MIFMFNWVSLGSMFIFRRVSDEFCEWLVIQKMEPVETVGFSLRDSMKFPGKPIGGCRCVFSC